MVKMRGLVTVILLMLCLGVHAQITMGGLGGLKVNRAEPVTFSISQQGENSAESLTIRIVLHMGKSIHMYSDTAKFFQLAISNSEGLDKGTILLPDPHQFTDFDKSTAGVYVDGQEIVVKHRLTSAAWKIAGTLQFQACDTVMCFTPRTAYFSASSDSGAKISFDPPVATTTATVDDAMSITEKLRGFTVAGIKGGFLKVNEFGAFLDNPAAAAKPGTSVFENRGLIVVILMILLGGIALNLTPCVLPMIPITLAVLGAGSQAKSRGRGMFVGAVYGGAMALTYGILGLAVVLTGTRFGVINASPVFNLVIAAIFVVMGLAMFDLFQVDFTRFRKNAAGVQERGKLATVFFMGVIAALLAGACVAPVVIAVVLYAGSLYAAGNSLGLLLPFLLGAGMALPWPFAAAGLSLLPKPGKWMVWVKYVFGVFILAMAFYYGQMGVKALLQSAAPDAQITQEKTHGEPSNVKWYTSLDEAINESRATGKPLFIDFWATWCKNCKAMDATTFKHPDVEKRFGSYVCVKYQAEKPGEAATKEILDYFKITGLPAYVVLEKK